MENKFTYASVSCTVSESFNGTTKEKVQIQNTGTTDAYIRATYVVTWRDMSGNVVPSVPDGYSYTLTENPDGKWKQIGDYFYYPTPVESGAPRSKAFSTATVTHPDNPEYVSMWNSCERDSEHPGERRHRSMGGNAVQLELRRE